jgi:XTP/dITP diphosphohydrolase
MCRLGGVKNPDPETQQRGLPELSPLPGKQTGAEVSRLCGLMQRLLAPGGCPWDREQTLQSLVPYLVEETYEVVDALAAGSVDDHREELGDLLLQIVFQSELRFAEGAFGIDDVARGIITKLVRRHPHVLGEADAPSAAHVEANWDRLKAAEKGRRSAVDGVPFALPALVLTTKLLGRAARAGISVDLGAGQDSIGRRLLDLVVEARAGGLDAEAELRATARAYAAAVRAAEPASTVER